MLESLRSPWRWFHPIPIARSSHLIAPRFHLTVRSNQLKARSPMSVVRGRNSMMGRQRWDALGEAQMLQVPVHLGGTPFGPAGT